MQPLLTPKDVAVILAVSEQTIYRMMDSLELQSVKIRPGKRECRRIKPEELQRFIDDNTATKPLKSFGSTRRFMVPRKNK